MDAAQKPKMFRRRTNCGWCWGLMISCVLGVFNPGFAAIPDAGTNNPFDLGAGSRALAMGSSYVALADDVSALFWNPGGLARLDQAEVSAMHINLYFDTPYDFIGAAYPLLDWGTFSLGAVRLGTSGILVRDERSHLIQSNGSMELREYLFGFSREIYGDVCGGAVIKIDQQRLLGDFDTGVGLDAGFHYRLPKTVFNLSGVDWESFTLGLSFQNLIGSQLRLKSAVDHLPMNLRCGLAYEYLSRDSLRQKIIGSFTFEKSTWRSSLLALGAEYSLYDMVALRAGWNSLAWSVGGGIAYSGIALDYALAGEELGLTHRFTLSYQFGPMISQQKADQEKRRQQAVAEEAQRQAKNTVDKNRKKLEEQLRAAEQQYRRDRAALLSDRDRLLREEREKQLGQQQAAVANEYFKALHYFQGVKDYFAKNYKDAMVEFETVAKYDPNYLEIQTYLNLTRQRMEGDVLFKNPDSMRMYYQAIDLYISERFDEAIVLWKKILENEPNNILVVRNIEEANERVMKIKNVKNQVEQEEQRPGMAPTRQPGKDKTQP